MPLDQAVLDHRVLERFSRDGELTSASSLSQFAARASSSFLLQSERRA